MAYQGNAKVQHYVPRFLLRHFGTGKKDRLHVFDKQTELNFSTNVKNVAAESRFYDFEFEGNDLTIEPGLELVESAAKPVIKAILDAGSLVHLTAEQRAKLSIFFAVQFARTKWFREQFRELPKQLGEHIQRVHGPDADVSQIEEYLKVPDDNELAFQIARFIVRNSRELAINFTNKIWVLASTDSKHPFVIGDHPFGLQNHIDMSPRGSLGLGVEGIEIHFPLSPKHALAMWCPSLYGMFKDAEAKVGRVSSVHEVLSAIETGTKLAYTPENVLKFNSLQIMQAERFVFSSSEDFSLVRRIIAENPGTKRGPRSSIA